jgi:hypothetical protein
MSEKLTIYKYPLDITDVQHVPIPLVATMLDVQSQGDKLCLWALVDPSSPLVFRTIRVYGTGQSVDARPAFYAGTAQTNGGALAWHVFIDE